MNYIIKSQSGYYQGTISGEHYFTMDINEALNFKNEKIAKGTIKFHGLKNVIVSPLSLNVATN